MEISKNRFHFYEIKNNVVISFCLFLYFFLKHDAKHEKIILSFSWKWNMNMLAALSWSKNASVVTVIEIWLELTTSAHATSTISGELATRQKNWVNDILVKRTAVSNRNKGKFYQNEKVANRPIFSLEMGLLGNTLLHWRPLHLGIARLGGWCRGCQCLKVFP